MVDATLEISTTALTAKVFDRRAGGPAAVVGIVGRISELAGWSALEYGWHRWFQHFAHFAERRCRLTACSAIVTAPAQ